MKKFYSFLLALGLILAGVNGYAYSTDGNPHLMDDSTATPADAVRVYRLVRFAQNSLDSVTLSGGDVVVWDCVSDDGVTIGLVTTVGSADAVAGVVVSPFIPTADSTGTAANSIGRRNWGYIQTSGLCTTVNITGGSATTGATLKASDTPRYATAAKSVSVDSNTTRTLGFSYDVSSQGQSEAHIDLR